MNLALNVLRGATLVALLTPAARAAPPARTAALVWERGEGAESCADTFTLAQSVERRLGRRVFVARTEAEAVVRGEIVREAPAAWDVSLELSDAQGRIQGDRHMRLQAERCQDLADAIALVIAVMLDPDAPTRPPPPAVPTPAPPTDAADLSVDVAASGLAGTLPGLAAGAWLGASWLRPQRFGIVGAIELAFPRSPADVRAGVQVNFWRAGLALGLCPWSRPGERLSVRACAGLDGALVSYEGRGFDRAQEGRRLTAGVHAGPRLDLSLARSLALFLSADLLVPIVRERFFFTEPDGTRRDVFRASPVGARLSLGGALF